MKYFSGCIWAAFGIFAAAPSFAVQEMSLQKAEDDLPPIFVEQTLSLSRGETLAQLLEKKTTLKGGNLYTAMHRLNKQYRLNRLQDGQLFDVSYKLADDGLDVNSIAFRTQDLHTVTVRMNDGAAEIMKEVIPTMKKEVASIGTIESSLYVSAKKADLPPAMIANFVNLFSFDVDFTRDLREGDTFRVVYEQIIDEDGNMVDTGNIVGAELNTRGKTFDAFRYSFNGKTDYFNSKGEGVRRSLLRTPLDVIRITSPFNPNRKHPILGYTRAHKGTDFGAPTGTPIKASGDGRIEFLGFNGGYGKYIRINHDGKYKTAYAHMHNYARSMKVGSRVRQGQVIGYVGTTGRSTGPHLHYEVLVNNVQVNPMNVALPRTKMPQKHLADFQNRMGSIIAMWENGSSDTRLAMVNEKEKKR